MLINFSEALTKKTLLPPFQNISKNESTKVDVFGQKFPSNTSIFVDPLMFIFWDENSTLNYVKR